MIDFERCQVTGAGSLLSGEMSQLVRALINFFWKSLPKWI